MVAATAPRWRLAAVVSLGALLGAGAASARAQQPPGSASPPDSAAVLAHGADSVTVRLVDVDLRAAVQALSRYLDRPVVFGAIQGQSRVTLETPRPVPRADVARLLRGLVESQNLELVADTASGIYRVRAREVRPPVGPPFPEAQAQQQRLAQQQAAGAVELFVIPLRHARAADVAATVNALYGRGSALGELGDRRGSGAGGGTGQYGAQRQDLMNPQPPPGVMGAGAPPVVAQPPGAVAGAVASVAGRQATLAGEVTIVPDPGTNSLLVRAARGDYDLIRAAVERLDLRPLQVMIEVAIVEARRDRSFQLGTGVTVPQSGVKGGGNTTVGGTMAVGEFGDLVATAMHLGGIDLTATLRLASSRGDVKILSKPVVLAANNEEARILVGTKRPFISVQRTLPTSDAVRDAIVDYQDVATELSVRPTISADGYVMLDVTQRVDAATPEQGLQNAPVIATRRLETRLLVKDRATVALGGLTDKQRERSSGGVPILSSIPWLGGLFGRQTRRGTETELFLFLTPRVIRDDAEAEEATTPMQQKAETTKP